MQVLIAATMSLQPDQLTQKDSQDGTTPAPPRRVLSVSIGCAPLSAIKRRGAFDARWWPDSSIESNQGDHSWHLSTLDVHSGTYFEGLSAVGYGFVSGMSSVGSSEASPAKAPYERNTPITAPPAVVPGTTQPQGCKLSVHSDGGGLVILHLEVDDDDPELAAYSAYCHLIDAGKRLGAPYFLRIWQFFDRIHDRATRHLNDDLNRPRGCDSLAVDDEAVAATEHRRLSDDTSLDRYQAFCVGRARALNEAGLPAGEMPAATAIGRPSGRPPRDLTITAVMAKRPGTCVENPRQTPAHRYPKLYGPQAPAFARATLVDGTILAESLTTKVLETGDRTRPFGLLFISGTAAIVGHESMHTADVLAQLDETLTNIEALVARASAMTEQTQSRTTTNPQASSGCHAFDCHHLRVYLRNPAHREIVLRRLDERLGVLAPTSWGNSIWIDCVHGEICREELLVEIEALFARKSIGA